MKTIVLTGGGTAGHCTPHFALLSILNLYKEVIDPFYTKRGEIAELILREKLKQKGF